MPGDRYFVLQGPPSERGFVTSFVRAFGTPIGNVRRYVPFSRDGRQSFADSRAARDFAVKEAFLAPAGTSLTVVRKGIFPGFARVVTWVRHPTGDTVSCSVPDGYDWRADTDYQREV